MVVSLCLAPVKGQSPGLATELEGPFCQFPFIARDMNTLPDSPSLARVARGNLCAGCGACAGIAPDAVSMVSAPPGFLRPHQTAPLSEDAEATIAAVCPGLGQEVKGDGREDHVLWGPYLSMETGWATDDALRYAGSSGGALSMLLVHLLESGTVDAVIQTAASPELAIANATVISADAEDILNAAGSRYAPSAPLAALHEQVKSGKTFAFVGKPCDVAAMRALQSLDAEVARTFPVLISFFCAGVPSHAGGEAVLKALGLAPEEAVSFRYRGHGWPGKATATLKDGTTREMSYHDSWGHILSKHVQHRCKICADGTGVAADLVCADAWESDEKGYPIFEEADGISLIVARTQKGAAILKDAKAANRLETRPFDVSVLADIQPGQRERRRALLARLSALRIAGRPVPTYRGLHIGAVARQNPIGRNLKNFLGMLRRTLTNR